MDNGHSHEHFASSLLTVPEAAQLLRISRNLAYELVAQHQLPSVRLGRTIRIPRDSLEQWIRERAEESALRPAAPHPLSYRREGRIEW